MIGEFTSAITQVIGVPSQGEIVNLLFPNVWVFASHILAAIILIILVVWLVWKPTKKYLKARKDSIEKEIKDAEQKNKDAALNFEKSKTEILDSKNTASSIIQSATIEAQNLKASIEKTAYDNASNYKKNAEIIIQKHEKEIYKNFDSEVSKLAIETAKNFLSKKIDEEENKKIIDEIISNLENETNNSSKEK